MTPAIKYSLIIAAIVVIIVILHIRRESKIFVVLQIHSNLLTEILAANTQQKWGIAYKKSLDFMSKCKHPDKDWMENTLKEALTEQQRIIRIFSYSGNRNY